MSWSQVTGWFRSSPDCAASDLRYQSSWVLAQNGTVTSSSCQVRAAQRALHHALADPGGHVGRHRGQEAGLGELRDVRRVEAHDVDRGVVGREPADQLLALLGRLPRQHAGHDLVPPAGRLGAPGGDLLLAAGVRVGVPGERGWAGRPTAAGGDPEHGRRGQGRRPQPPVPTLAHPSPPTRSGPIPTARARGPHRPDQTTSRPRLQGRGHGHRHPGRSTAPTARDHPCATRGHHAVTRSTDQGLTPERCTPPHIGPDTQADLAGKGSAVIGSSGC